MQPSTESYDTFLERFTLWATAQPNIRAATIIGSRARHEDPADEWSDVDVLLLARQPSAYLADGRWLDQFGQVWLTHVQRLPVGGGEERRAMFDGALEVDFAVLSSRKVWQARVALGLLSRVPSAERLLSRDVRGQIAAMSDVFGRGATVLVDKDGLMKPLPHTDLDLPQSAKPSEPLLVEATNRFWHGSVWVAKHLRRGELWRAQDGCDVRMKATMLQFIEWHAKATKGWDSEHMVPWTFSRTMGGSPCRDGPGRHLRAP